MVKAHERTVNSKQWPGVDCCNKATALSITGDACNSMSNPMYVNLKGSHRLGTTGPFEHADSSAQLSSSPPVSDSLSNGVPGDCVHGCSFAVARKRSRGRGSQYYALRTTVECKWEIVTQMGLACKGHKRATLVRAFVPSVSAILVKLGAGINPEG